MRNETVLVMVGTWEDYPTTIYNNQTNSNIFFHGDNSLTSYYIYKVFQME